MVHSRTRGWLGLWVLLGSLPLFAQETPGRTPWFSSSVQQVAASGVMPSSLRVLILRTRAAVTIGCEGGYQYVALQKGKPQSMDSSTTLRIKATARGIALGKKKIMGSLLVSTGDPANPLLLNGRPYRGFLILKPRGHGQLDVIEELRLEEYLYGVLPREVGVDWPADALKAQAVVSRTYVLANLGKFASQGYDVSSDVFTQVYGGLQSENPATNQAVDATQGDVLVDPEGAPIQAFFHSSCGGMTESPQYVWREMQNPPSYLVSVKDPYCKEDPYRTWHYEISGKALARRLHRAGLYVGDVRKMKITKRSPSGRAWMIAVYDANGAHVLTSNRFRMAVGVDVFRSTLLTDISGSKKRFRFEGHGWGHGVGLCQWGARGRALDGQSFTTILQAYYPTTLMRQYQEAPTNATH